MKVLITIIALVIIVGVAFYLFRNNASTTESEETVFCTLDAMLCPDGSYVGRVPPDCEFAACPSGSTSTSTSTSTPSGNYNAS